MEKKKAYPLRINEDVLKAMQIWADDELRSLNAQIEYVLRQSLVKSKRVRTAKTEPKIELKDED